MSKSLADHDEEGRWAMGMEEVGNLSLRLVSETLKHCPLRSPLRSHSSRSGPHP